MSDWFPDWRGQACCIIAGGASAQRANVPVLNGRFRVVVVNNSYELAPWADALYAADGAWWAKHKAALTFAGLKITQDANASKVHRIKKIELSDFGSDDENRMCLDRPGRVGRGGNSGFQALNLTAQFGARRIALVGFDFSGDHWHGRHPQGLRNPRPETLLKWAKILDGEADRLAEAGFEIVNTSPLSALKNYQTAPLEDVVRAWT